MIVVKLKGGLGNQMFQYAFGKSLSLQLSQPLVLDNSFFATHAQTPGITPREFELLLFSIPEKIINSPEVFGFGPAFPYRLNRLIHPWLKKLKGQVILTDHNQLPVSQLRKVKNTVLDGYFQSENYFIQNESAIRKAFTFKEPLDGENAALAKVMASGNSVSIHVRRGDYISNANAQQLHAICGVEYYSTAIQLLQSSFPDLQFFIFSDDIAWCRANLNLAGSAVFVSHNSGRNSYKDLQLMSQCKHHIIANSSFSWWGAWLGTFTDKMVVAPRNWYVNDQVDTKDLYPKSWKII